MPATGDDLFDLDHLAHYATVLRQLDDVEHVLLTDGFRHLQLLISAGTVLAGPVRLEFRLVGTRHLLARALSLRRLGSIVQHGTFPLSLYRQAKRADRWTMELQAWDGERAGVDRRQVAAAIFGKEPAYTRWEAGYRARMQRLVRNAGKKLVGGYLDLLAQGPDQ